MAACRLPSFLWGLNAPVTGRWALASCLVASPLLIPRSSQNHIEVDETSTEDERGVRKENEKEKRTGKRAARRTHSPGTSSGYQNMLVDPSGVTMYAHSPVPLSTSTRFCSPLVEDNPGPTQTTNYSPLTTPAP